METDRIYERAEEQLRTQLAVDLELIASVF